MEPARSVCASCGRELRRGAGRCRACGAWQPEAAWDRALYYGFALLAAAMMGLRWWLRRETPGDLTLADVRVAWLHPLVVAPLALTAVYAVRLWKRR